ncbi:MAG: iron-sulfur cluster assembly scaffold protein [Pseudomonadota bacterium]
MNDLIKLYSGRILALAADIPHLGRLADPDATEMRRSPLCGSAVTVDLMLEGGRVADFAQDVKACALGQAAAAVLGRAVIGLSLDEVRKGRDALHRMLAENGPAPKAPFEDLQVLAPAQAFKNRHASILLSFDATVAAMEAVTVPG